MNLSALKSNIIALFKQAIKTQKSQSTFIYCENCNNELYSSNSFISDSYDQYNIRHVIYKCSICQTIVDYNFDIAPYMASFLPLKR